MYIRIYFVLTLQKYKNIFIVVHSGPLFFNIFLFMFLTCAVYYVDDHMFNTICSYDIWTFLYVGINLYELQLRYILTSVYTILMMFCRFSTIPSDSDILVTLPQIITLNRHV